MSQSSLDMASKVNFIISKREFFPLYSRAITETAQMEFQICVVLVWIIC
jgi:hypothetical protein